jgi:MFS family permease
MLPVLRSRDFRLLWSSQAVSSLGDELVLVAMALFVTRLTHHASDVGLVLAAYALPMTVFVLIGGVIADRLPRQAVMMGSDVVRMVLHGTLAVLIFAGVVRVWHIVAIGVVFGLAEAFFRPAFSGLIPQTVPEQDIQSAQAVVGISGEIAVFASPALATALVLGVSGGAAFALDAATFAVSAVLLSRVRGRSRGPVGEPSSVRGELREGWQAVKERPWVWATISSYSVALLLGLAPFFVVGATVAHDVYGSEAVFGISNAAWGLGAVSAAVVGSKWRPRRPMLVGTLVSAPWGLCIVAFAAGPPVEVVYLLMAAGGAGYGLFTIWWDTALAERIPPHLLSRVSAWDWMGTLALLPLGYVLAGPLAEVVGSVRLLVVGGAVSIGISLLGILPTATRTLTRLEAA